MSLDGRHLPRVPAHLRRRSANAAPTVVVVVGGGGGGAGRPVGHSEYVGGAAADASRRRLGHVPSLEGLLLARGPPPSAPPSPPGDRGEPVAGGAGGHADAADGHRDPEGAGRRAPVADHLGEAARVQPGLLGQRSQRQVQHGEGGEHGVQQYGEGRGGARSGKIGWPRREQGRGTESSNTHGVYNYCGFFFYSYSTSWSRPFFRQQQQQ